ncbi:hypothetical protein F544_1300 [Bibersteinia trehalosi USDA-ARS-USMARC-190]|uniref:Methyl-accepting chemotaxis protein n=1 Tax=Bibersteinia trehalosi USDA-ARS-USMARC-190 TaxID=1263832 RepID=W0R503_BIBTR|nr:hypothetical protein [Bibersteinia trehalosi]AHG85365.1 hypothetical protein F544_1300 [Bibersteinia trehalosi USDA-ARS-USMARC-190]
MDLKPILKAPPEQRYIKNSSMLVTGLFIIAGVLYYPTQGYGAVIALALALFVLLGQKLLIAQTKRYFAEMYAAKQQFEQSGNLDYLEFIRLRGTQMLSDNKVLADSAKTEIQTLLAFVHKHKGA